MKIYPQIGFSDESCTKRTSCLDKLVFKLENNNPLSNLICRRQIILLPALLETFIVHLVTVDLHLRLTIANETYRSSHCPSFLSSQPVYDTPYKYRVHSPSLGYSKTPSKYRVTNRQLCCCNFFGVIIGPHINIVLKTGALPLSPHTGGTYYHLTVLQSLNNNVYTFRK